VLSNEIVGEGDRRCKMPPYARPEALLDWPGTTEAYRREAAVRKVIIEVRQNEYARRDINPHVPWTPAEIAQDAKECQAAGASIAHFHARGANGVPDHSYEVYRDTVAALRKSCDMLIHPTLGAYAASGDAAARLSHIVRLVEDGLKPDLVPLDVASSNADMVDPATNRFVTDDVVYVNSTRTLHYFAERLREAGIKPYAQAWNIPSLRQIIAFARSGVLAQPLFLALTMTEGGALSSHPGSSAGLQAYLPFLPEGMTFQWSTTLFGGNLLPLVGMIVERGGHISIGIGDYPYTEIGTPTNAQLVARVAQIIRDSGNEVASPADVRAMIGLGVGKTSSGASAPGRRSA